MGMRHAPWVLALVLWGCGGSTQGASNDVPRSDGGVDQAAGSGGSGGTAGTGGVGGVPDAGGSECNQNLTFDDPLVEAAVRQGAGVPTGPISPDDVAGLTYLIVEKGAGRLGGVECLPELESVAAREGTIEDLSPLRQLQKLRTVAIERNRVRDLSPLSDLPMLRAIYADDNLVANLEGLGVVLSHECALELRLVGNSVGDADVQPFCDLGWVVTWGSGDGGAVSTCNRPCL